MKEKTKTINDWEELLTFVNSINPYRETLVLTGWYNVVWEDVPYAKKLMFTTKPVDKIMTKEKKKKEDGTTKTIKKRKKEE